MTLNVPTVSGTAGSGSSFALGLYQSDDGTPYLSAPLVEIDLDAIQPPTVTRNSPNGGASVNGDSGRRGPWLLECERHSKRVDFGAGGWALLPESGASFSGFGGNIIFVLCVLTLSHRQLRLEGIMRVIAIAALFMGAVFGQATERFEAADVHPSPHSDNNFNLFMRGPQVRADRYEIRTATMVDLISVAYGVDSGDRGVWRT